MQKKMMIIVCSLLVAFPALSFAEEKKVPVPSVSAKEQADVSAELKQVDLSNSETNQEIRAKKLDKKETAKEIKKTEEVQNKDDGQFKVKF